MTPTPLLEELAGESRQDTGPLERRERLTEGVLACLFLSAAVAMATLLPWERSLDATSAVVLVLLLAAASRVRIEDGTGHTDPTQLVLVPMLFFLPVPVVPLAVAAGNLVGYLPELLSGKRHPSRAVVSLGDASYAIGPALVFGFASPGSPDLDDWAVLLAALGAQFTADFVVSTTREWIGLGISPRVQPRLLWWVYTTDACLASIGLFAAVIVADEPLALLLLAPLPGLLILLAREREGRITNALELSAAYRGTAHLLGDVVEADDAYTGSHSRSVVDLSVRVADRMGLDPRARRNVEFAALLHDVGKIAIPKAIINKRGPLDEEEWTLMRTHTIRGQELLDRVGGALGEVGRIVRASHERFDGNGYPDGLAGRDIPIEARIVSCCDAFNAMTTSRSYREAMAEADALRELVDHAGSQFDPKVVRTLVAILRRPTAGLPRLIARDDRVGAPAV